MKRFALTAAAAVIAIGAGVTPSFAACNGDTSTETALGAGSGALVGGLASHSLVGAVVGGVGGGLIGNAIGHSNNRDDCRRARAAYGERHDGRDYRDGRDYYVDRDGHRHYYYR